ncbi:TPA: hypothetical protein JBD00_10065 [Legionella pneumophila subsp. pneumophila]|uniref:hypothetical protein n=2 Tax=Legionella pneumophila TaxID=446 RepID=UPI000486E909|nr:hypothetical protein [Legionella pneumophila]STY14453.1 Uncharacterised protein [Legionella pneumophila]HAT1740814.1 hypothetical protein [Legionella pneumophila]HAT1745934.1 hypothetical protein [Legionella pneumophila]HAT1749564.1 hypothetical protein [Legionella pneumophila]HAT1754785.1 hypothetical protein [Legionella pneumophila]
MTKLEGIIAFILAVIAIKVLINAYKLMRLIKLEKKYQVYMKAKSQEADIIPDFLEKVPEIIELLKQAGQKSKIISRLQDTGLGYVQNLQGDLFENITTRDSEIYTEISTRLKYAMGVYKKRMCESVNPVYWIEFLIFLPKNIVEYLLGGEQNTIPNWAIRLLNIAYWAIGLFGSLFGILDYFK